MNANTCGRLHAEAEKRAATSAPILSDYKAADAANDDGLSFAQSLACTRMIAVLLVITAGANIRGIPALLTCALGTFQNLAGVRVRPSYMRVPRSPLFLQRLSSPTSMVWVFLLAVHWAYGSLNDALSDAAFVVAAESLGDMTEPNTLLRNAPHVAFALRAWSMSLMTLAPICPVEGSRDASSIGALIFALQLSLLPHLPRKTYAAWRLIACVAHDLAAIPLSAPLGCFRFVLDIIWFGIPLLFPNWKRFELELPWIDACASLFFVFAAPPLLGQPLFVMTTVRAFGAASLRTLVVCAPSFR